MTKQERELLDTFFEGLNKSKLTEELEKELWEEYFKVKLYLEGVVK